MRPWTTDHPEPWTGPCVCQGQRRRTAVLLRPPLCSRSLAGKAGVKRRHQSCTGTEEEEKRFLLLKHNFLGASFIPHTGKHLWHLMPVCTFGLKCQQYSFRLFYCKLISRWWWCALPHIWAQPDFVLRSWQPKDCLTSAFTNKARLQNHP